MARRTSGPAQMWVKRGAIAIGVGLVIGLGAGIAAVRTLQPAVTAPVETLPADTATKKKRATKQEDNAPTQAAARESLTVVPKLIGLDEGDARTAIEGAGFTVGTILFRPSGERAGMVLETFPVPGERVPLPATINLVLSDGHPRTDTIPDNRSGSSPTTPGT